MKINIYYGGRGLINDPTLYVINKMQEVFEELNVTVERFNLYELKNNITTLPQSLKSADGIILSSTVEWYGIGGYMHQFLDACWQYGDKEKISQLYMCPIVMSTTYGEREGKLTLSSAWEILGGLPCSGMCGYIDDIVNLELNKEYAKIIEKKAENMYRTISQKVMSFPSSNHVVKSKVSKTQVIDLTPQETEQLSQYVSDDNYVQRQKQDLQELSSLFKDMIGNIEVENTKEYIQDFEKYYKPRPGFKAVYKIGIDDRKVPLVLEVNGPNLQCEYKLIDSADVEIQMTSHIISEIIAGHMTFQRAFMGGNMKMKGDFKILRTLDQIFAFSEVVL